MLSQTFCLWDKQQSAETDSNIIQFYLTLKCMKDQSSQFCDYFLVSKYIFQHHDRVLTKFHAGSEQPLVCVVINNSSYSSVKNNHSAYHAFRKYWMQARGLLNYRLKCWWLKATWCLSRPNELERELDTQLEPNCWPARSFGDMAHPGSLLESPLVWLWLNVWDSPNKL